MLKLTKIAAADTGVLKLLDSADEPMLTDDGKRVTVTVYSPGSKQYQAAKAAQQNRMVAKLQKKGSANETAESKTKNDAAFLAAITASDEHLDIEGLTDGLDGEKKYLAIYGHTPIGFIGDQVARFAADWANFSQGSAKS